LGRPQGLLISIAESRSNARLAQWREDTPGCANRNHLNNAGAALMPEPVLRSMVAHLNLEAQIAGWPLRIANGLLAICPMTCFWLK